MAEAEPAANWSLKDALIAIPFAASALALTWEIGYFVPIKGAAFGLFSIAEHLTFALQALPIALMVASAALLGLVFNNRSRPRPVQERVLFRILTILPFLLAAGVTIAVWYFFATSDFALIFLSLVSTFPYAVLSVAPRRLLINPMFVYSGILMMFFAAIAIGGATARLQIRSSAPLNSIKFGEKGKDVETEMMVRVLRTGERGVLYFDPTTQGFGLLPWDYVKRVGWANSPLLPSHF